MTTYRESGVDIDAGHDFVSRLKNLCPSIGGFGGFYPLGNQYLVSGADGVGTKLKLAFETGVHNTVGIDLVAMCVNDIATSGAKPLFFLDYFATSKLDVDQAEKVISGILEGCKEAGCALLGGETAEMPGFYKPGEYDLSGFAVGIVDRDKVVDGSKITPGCAVIGLPSSGVHSNGFSLIRSLLDKTEADPTLLQQLMTPTRLYPKIIALLSEHYHLLGLAHITGGGIVENVPRMLPEGCGVTLDGGSWDIPPIFDWIQKTGGVDVDEMRRTFNMGIGMAVVVAEHEADSLCREFNLPKIGFVTSGEGVVWNS